MRLEGKVALITGGARGQGAAEARLFSQEGAKVVIGDVLDDEGAQLAAEIGELGGDALFVHLDVTSEENWREAIGAATSSFGKLDILVNNAAIWRGGRVTDTTSEHWDSVMDVNAKGVFLGTKLAIPEMRKAGGGSIINISSVAGFGGEFDQYRVQRVQGGGAAFHQVHGDPVRQRRDPGQLDSPGSYRHGHG